MTSGALPRRLANTVPWLPGEALPGVISLAAEYQVGKSTVARAIKILTNEGRVYTVRGWGTFVSENPPG
jgi:DNA-binding GntR family transcriptional regulator